MSVVILGGNECMVRRYQELCASRGHRAKVYTHLKCGMGGKIGSPDLLVLFTGTMSHKLLKSALNEVRGGNTVVARSHSGSMAALKSILETHAG